MALIQRKDIPRKAEAPPSKTNLALIEVSCPGLRDSAFATLSRAQNTSALCELYPKSPAPENGAKSEYISAFAAREVAARIQAGTVWVNSHGAVDPRIPFGGTEGSGYGIEFGEIGL